MRFLKSTLVGRGPVNRGVGQLERTMPNELSPQQYEAVVALPADDRYSHAIGRIADWQEVWSLKDGDGFVLMANDAGDQVVPIWPHPDYAARCATGQWSAAKPELIPLEAFIQKWIPGMQRDGKLVSVFPLPQGKGATVGPEQLARDLDEELDQYD